MVCLSLAALMYISDKSHWMDPLAEIEQTYHIWFQWLSSNARHLTLTIHRMKGIHPLTSRHRMSLLGSLKYGMSVSGCTNVHPEKSYGMDHIAEIEQTYHIWFHRLCSNAGHLTLTIHRMKGIHPVKILLIR